MSERLSDDFDDLLARQRGVFARWQLPAITLEPGVVAASLRSDRFRRLYRGVYAAFTGPPCREAELWAAVLRAGPDAQAMMSRSRVRWRAEPQTGSG